MRSLNFRRVGKILHAKTVAKGTRYLDVRDRQLLGSGKPWSNRLVMKG